MTRPLPESTYREVPGVTDAMVDAYLQANDAYWKRTDELPQKPDKWRNGTPREATRESLRAALATLQGLSPAQATKEFLTDDDICALARDAGLDWHQGFALDDGENRYVKLARAAIQAALSLPVEAPGDVKLPAELDAATLWLAEARDSLRKLADGANQHLTAVLHAALASPSNGIAGDAAPQEQPHVSFVDGDSERAIEKWLSTIDPVAEADTEDQSHLAGGASQSVREQAVAYWECRSFDIEHGVWFPWGRVEGSARYPLEQRLADIRAKIAEGSRWELRALYASSLPAPSGLLDRVKAAEQRVQDNRAPRSIPADARDVDLVLAEVRYWLEGNWPPFWIKDAALHQAHQKGGA